MPCAGRRTLHALCEGCGFRTNKDEPLSCRLKTRTFERHNGAAPNPKNPSPGPRIHPGPLRLCENPNLSPVTDRRVRRDENATRLRSLFIIVCGSESFAFRTCTPHPEGRSVPSVMRCPKCQFDHELQTTECLKCGIVFSRYYVGELGRCVGRYRRAHG